MVFSITAPESLNQSRVTDEANGEEGRLIDTGA